MKLRRLISTGAAILALLATGPLVAIINPNFTPADLIQQSAQVLLGRVEVAGDDGVRLTVVETLRGDSRDGEVITLDLAGSNSLDRRHIETALAGRRTGTAVLVLTELEADGGDTPVGALQVETIWFAVHRRGGKLVLEEDGRKLFAVWGGDATRLAAATRRIQADRLVGFPTASDLIWEDDRKLGILQGPGTACLPVDLGGGDRDLLVASPAGDRVYRWGADGGPKDVTAELGLTTRSHRVVPADVDGDGRIDLVSWNGEALGWAARTPEGTFAAFAPLVPLAECRSLDAIADPAGAAAMVVGAAAGPRLVRRDAAGAWSVTPLPGEAAGGDAGPGGCCAVADFDGDGLTDVATCYAKAVVVHRGAANETGFAPAERLAVGTLREPRVTACADFDGDGRLDIAVAGGGGVALLGWHDGQELSNFTGATAELAYHGNQHDPEVDALSPGDINADGKEAVGLFYRERKPMLFFNRGFACIGWARKLELGYAEEEDPLDVGLDDPPPAADDPADRLPGLASLQAGQETGCLADLDGDGALDLVGVDKDHVAWAVRGVLDRGGRTWSLTLSLPPAATGPRLVTLRRGDRALGVRLLRPGRPVDVSLDRAGPVQVTWKDPAGKDQEAQAVVAKSRVRLVLPR